jgi:hypothetical protein
LNGKYHGSPKAALMTVYPEHKWLEWKFLGVPKRFWSDPENQKRFLEQFKLEKSINTPEDWYQICREDIHNAGGGSFLSSKFGDSIYKLVASLYPNHTFLEWKFDRSPRSFWVSKANRKKFMDWVKQQLNISTPSMWYTVTSHQIAELGGSFVSKPTSSSKFSPVS